jgi:hypothetical protein
MATVNICKKLLFHQLDKGYFCLIFSTFAITSIYFLFAIWPAVYRNFQRLKTINVVLVFINLTFKATDGRLEKNSVLISFSLSARVSNSVVDDFLSFLIENFNFESGYRLFLCFLRLLD